MIASAHTMRRSITSARAVKFLSLLPAIHEQARFAFRSHEPEHRQELIAEADHLRHAPRAVRHQAGEDRPSRRREAFPF
jgi:hypothetical protein